MENRRLKQLVVLLSVLLIIGCSTNKVRNPFQIDLNSEESQKPFLELNISYKECGEWGGHKEKLTLFSIKNNIKIVYKRFCIDCSKIQNGDKDFEKLTDSIEVNINNRESKRIVDLTCSLLKNKYVETFPDRHGIYYHLIKYKNSGGEGFEIKGSTKNENILKEYNKIKSQLGLPINYNNTCLLPTNLDEIE